MSKIPTIARYLLGALFTMSAIAGLMGKVPPPEPEAAQVFMGALYGSGLLVIVKVMELIAGLALLSGFFVPLAQMVLAPFVVVIAWYHVALDPAGAAVGIVLLVLWSATSWGYLESFRPILASKPAQ